MRLQWEQMRGCGGTGLGDFLGSGWRGKVVERAWGEVRSDMEDNFIGGGEERHGDGLIGDGEKHGALEMF